MVPPDPMMAQQAMMMGMPPPPPVELPSIEPDFDVDNHPLEADICRRWLVSDAGRMTKLENPNGYKNVLLHMKMHKDMDMQKQMQDMQKQMMAQQGMMPPVQQAGQGAPVNQQQGPQGPPPASTGQQLGVDEYEPVAH